MKETVPARSTKEHVDVHSSNLLSDIVPVIYIHPIRSGSLGNRGVSMQVVSELQASSEAGFISR